MARVDPAWLVSARVSRPAPPPSPPAAAAKHRAGSIYKSPLLWATVNVCDTPASPDTIGVRGSMTGSGHRGEQMYIRFRVQYFSRSERHWPNITSGADSGWIAVGSARFKVRQAGWSFRFLPPRKGPGDP